MTSDGDKSQQGSSQKQIQGRKPGESHGTKVSNLIKTFQIYEGITYPSLMERNTEIPDIDIFDNNKDFFELESNNEDRLHREELESIFTGRHDPDRDSSHGDLNQGSDSSHSTKGTRCESSAKARNSGVFSDSSSLEYEDSYQSDPFSDNFSGRYYSAAGSLNSCNVGEESSESNSEFKALDAQDVAGPSLAARDVPPPLPPRMGTYNSPGNASRTSQRNNDLDKSPSRYKGERGSSLGKHTTSTFSRNNVLRSIKNDLAKDGSPIKLQSVDTQVLEQKNVIRNAPYAKNLGYSRIFTKSRVISIDVYGGYMCTVGSSVRFFDLKDGSNFLSLQICGTQDSSINSNARKLPFSPNRGFSTKKRNGRLDTLYVFKVQLPENNITKLCEVSGNYIYGSQLNKNSLSSQFKKENVTAACFIPSASLKVSPCYVLLGTEKGSLVCADVVNTHFAYLCAKPVHVSKIFHILRCRTDIYVIDYTAYVSIWSITDDVFTLKVKFSISTSDTCLKSDSVKCLAVCASNGNLYIAHCGCIYFIKVSKNYSISINSCSCREIGTIKSIASRGDKFFLTGHSDGKVGLWDSESRTMISLTPLSAYSIETMVFTKEDTVWIGLVTGKVIVCNINPKAEIKWTVMNSFVAYESSSVLFLTVNREFLLTNDQLQVISLNVDGSVKFWDGFLTDTCIASLMKEREEKYCKFRPIKVLICSWNVDAIKPKDIEEIDKGFFTKWMSSESEPDVVVIGIQEMVDLVSTKVNAREFLSKGQRKNSSQSVKKMNEYINLWKSTFKNTLAVNNWSLHTAREEEMIGLFQAVFVKSSEINAISDISSAHVKTGLKGYHGNKGAVAIRFRIDDSSMCFVNCHLAAHQNQVSARNKNISSIFRHARFPKIVTALDSYNVENCDGNLIADHEIIFWFGDLNYRIGMDRRKVLQLIKSRDWDILLKFEQLNIQKNSLPGFDLRNFREGKIDFSPTFKYDVGTDNYDTSDKRRVPSWCDRILYFGDRVEQVMYDRLEINVSDHRPIKGSFNVNIKKIDTNLFKLEFSELKKYVSQLISDHISKEKVNWLSLMFNLSKESSMKILQDHNMQVLSAIDYILNLQQKSQS